MEGLTLSKAYTTAVGDEAGRKQASELQVQVNLIPGFSKKPSKPTWYYRCGKSAVMH